MLKHFLRAGVAMIAIVVLGVVHRAKGAGASTVSPTPPTPPDQSIARMHVKQGFRAELMVSEPLVTDPIAIAWGPDGKLWVVEMTDYPLGKTGHMDPAGRIVYLESTHNDGKYDKVTVFAENLNFPNGILPWRKGVIVTAAPEILYLEDTTGSGKADKKEVLYTGFTEANPQLRINCPTYGLDNWVYLANGLGSRGTARSMKTGAEVKPAGHDLRIQPDEGLIELETGVSQYGRRMDDRGNWFGVDNSNPVRQFVIPERYATRNPDAQLPHGADEAGQPLNPKVYPVSKGQKRYGYAFFAQSGHFTSACSILPYRDDLLFNSTTTPAGADDVFVCEPAHNLVQHLVLKPNGTSFVAARAPDEQFNEFLASEDTWCRPVFLANGPDSALWMVDMYRYFIDHPEFLPPDGQRDMAPYYRLGEDKGRIYRIFPTGKTPRPIPRLDTLDTPQLVAALETPSGWQRDIIRMMLVWRNDPAAVAPLEQLATHSPSDLARLHALCALDGLGKLQSNLVEHALSDASPAVRRQALRLSEARAKDAPHLIDAAIRLVNDPSPMVRLQLAFTLGEWNAPQAGQALATLAVNAGDDTYLSAAVMSSASHHYEAIADALITANKAGPITRDLLGMALARDNRGLAARLLAPILTPHDGKFDAEQFKSFARFLDRLAQHHTTLAKLENAEADALADRLHGTSHLFDAARQAANDSHLPADQRIAAIGLLGRDATRADEDLKLLESLLAPAVPPLVQTAAVRAFARFDRPDIPAILTRNWKDDSRAVRSAILDVVLSREGWAYAFLQRVQARDLPAAEIDPIRRERFTRHASQRVRDLAKVTVGEASALSRTKVVEDYRPALSVRADAGRGAKVFAQNCTTCHHLAGIGNEIGPNLQSVAGWKPDALLTAILDPSLSAEPRYLGYNCTLDTGEVVYGLLVRESAAGVVMKGLDGKDREVPRHQVQSLECTNRSLMPDGLEAAIDRQRMADLIKFLRSQK
jgi:putative membrane-bound dehydrogenase-like protein